MTEGRIRGDGAEEAWWMGFWDFLGFCVRGRKGVSVFSPFLLFSFQLVLAFFPLISADFFFPVVVSSVFSVRQIPRFAR
jgi:hypothetical protein